MGGGGMGEERKKRLSYRHPNRCPDGQLGAAQTLEQLSAQMHTGDWLELAIGVSGLEGATQKDRVVGRGIPITRC